MEDRSVRTMLVTVADGLQDPSIRGIQLRFDLRNSPDGWEAVEVGLRRKCQRGPDMENWTRDVCPQS